MGAAGIRLRSTALIAAGRDTSVTYAPRSVMARYSSVLPSRGSRPDRPCVGDPGPASSQRTRDSGTRSAIGSVCRICQRPVDTCGRRPGPAAARPDSRAMEKIVPAGRRAPCGCSGLPALHTTARAARSRPAAVARRADIGPSRGVRGARVGPASDLRRPGIGQERRGRPSRPGGAPA